MIDSSQLSSQYEDFLSTYDDVVGRHIGVSSGTKEDVRNLVFNDYLTDKSNKQSMENWLTQQEYNTPKEQMKRFAEAGLNPNLVYSQGNSGNASSAADVKANPAFQSKKEERKLQRWSAINSTIGTLTNSVGNLLGTLQGVYGIQQQKQEIAAKNLELGAMSRMLASPAIANYSKFAPVYPRVTAQLDDGKESSSQLFDDDFQRFSAAIAFPSAYRTYLTDLYQTDQRAYLNTRNTAAKYWFGQDSTAWELYGKDSQRMQYQTEKYNLDFLNNLSPTERTIYKILMDVLNVGGRYTNLFVRRR